jgi:hypothetical protein
MIPVYGVELLLGPSPVIVPCSQMENKMASLPPRAELLGMACVVLRKQAAEQSWVTTDQQQVNPTFFEKWNKALTDVSGGPSYCNPHSTAAFPHLANLAARLSYPLPSFFRVFRSIHGSALQLLQAICPPSHLSAYSRTK